MNASANKAQPASITRLPTWAEHNRQWLVAAISRLAERFEAWKGDSTEPPTPVADSVETLAAGFTPALIHCARVFELSPFERELLLLVAGLELDNRLRAAVAMQNGGASVRASYGLALATLTQPHWDALSPDAPLRYWQMVEPEPGGLLTQTALHIDERILHFIAGIAASDTQLVGVASPVDARAANVDGGDLPLARRVAQFLAGEPQAVIVLHGSEQDVTRLHEHAVAALAQIGRPALWLASHDLPADADRQALLARRVDREAALVGSVPVLSIGDSSSEAAATGLAGRLRSAFLWLGTPGHGLSTFPQGRRVLRLEVPAPDARRTRRMLATRWQRMSPPNAEYDGAIGTAFDRVTEQFHLGPAALDSIVETLRTTPPADRAAAVWSAAREAARGGLDALAQRIVTQASFADLVLPAGQSAMLRDIARQLRHRERVYRDWGFGAKHQLGQGLVALFAGGSGTGKTLAAEAIAIEVGLDLYRVDLATLVSKYIGETEKNLKRLFAAAETSGAVLLFDEADALFGKRSEVKDSHDRYANIEVAYLLQRVEAYRGLAVLTTNMKSALDRAFLRRIRFVVTFPFPDAAAREQIWRLQFPPCAPLGEVDFAALSRLNLSGGNIRSVAVNAAFKAADRDGRIDQGVIMEATHEEFAKLERNLSITGDAS